MIYFIRNIISGNIKIGFSDTPTKRLKDLQTGSADKLVLMKTIPGDKELEADIHQQFSHCRLDGVVLTYRRAPRIRKRAGS